MRILHMKTILGNNEYLMNITSLKRETMRITGTSMMT